MEKGNDCIYFSAFPTSLENTEFSDRGLTGCLEILGGLPALSVGIDEDNYFMRLQSNVFSGIHVKSDFQPLKIGRNLHFKVESDRWLEEARCHLVYKDIESQHNITITTSEWFTNGNSVRTTVTFKNDENQLKTLTAQYEFHPESWLFHQSTSEIIA